MGNNYWSHTLKLPTLKKDTVSTIMFHRNKGKVFICPKFCLKAGVERKYQNPTNKKARIAGTYVSVSVSYNYLLKPTQFLIRGSFTFYE